MEKQNPSELDILKPREIELQKANLIIEGIINTIPSRVFWKDINLVYLGCNTAFAHDAGYSDPKEVIGKDDFQLLWSDRAELYRSDDREVIESGTKKMNIEEPVTNAEGKNQIVLTSKAPLLNADGEVIGVLGTYMDITESKLTEEKIREQDIKYRKLSANVPDLIFQFTRKPDGSYCVPLASEGIKNIFGCSPEDVVDDFTPIASVIYPEDSERVMNEIEYSARHLTYFTCEFRVQIPGKKVQWIYSRSSPEKLADGSITWYGFNADITEIKEASEELKKKTKELEHFNKFFINRELKMVELKNEINDLLIKAGGEKKY
ncbi:PAS domain-containing protein [Bacteroidota bacterium]